MGIKNRDNALYMATGIDNSGLAEDAEQGKKIVKDMTNSIVQEGSKMKDGFAKGGEGIGSITDKIKDFKVGIVQMESDIKSLQSTFENAAPGKAKLFALKELNGAKKALQESKDALVYYEAQVKASTAAPASLRSQIRQLKEEMARTKEGTEEYTLAMKKLGELTDLQGDIAAQGKIFGDDERNIRSTVEAVNLLSGAMSVGMGVSALFGAEDEKLAEIQTRLQSVMAITIGLQQVATTLNKDSYFRRILLVKANDLLTASTTRLSVALGISNVAAKALMATLTLGLSIAITGLIVLWNKYSERAEAAAERQRQAQQQISGAINSVIGTMADQMVTLHNLIKRWDSLGDNLKKKKKFIDENKDAFHSLGITVNTVNEAENALVKNTGSVIKAMQLRAQAAAYQKIAQEEYEKMARAELQAQFVEKAAPIEEDYKKAQTVNYKGGGVIGYYTDKSDIANAEANRQKRANNLRVNARMHLIWGDHVMKSADELNSELSKELGNVGINEYTGSDTYQKDKDAANKAREKAEKLREQTDKYKILLSNQSIEEKRAAEDLQTSVEEARIKSMTDGSEKFIAQMELNFEKEMQAIDREKEDVLRKKIDDARSAFEANPKNKGKSFDASGISLSNTEITAFDEKYKAVIAGFDKDNNAQRVSELQMMWDYLKEYGTIQQQKLAIAEEYNEKIAKSTDEWQKKSLEAERDAKITSIETDAIKANIDWTTVFSEFGGMFSDVIKPALEEAKKYVQTDKFKNSDQASQKTLIDAINQMEKTIGGTGTLNFKKLGQDIKTYQAAEQRRILAIEEETKAIEKRKKAQEDYDKAMKGGTDQQKKSAQEALNNAKNNETTASANVKTQTDIANKTQQGVTDTATKLKNTMDNVVEGLSQMASGGISNAYQGFILATKDAKGALGKLSESLSNVPIVGWILSIIDVLKDGLSNLVGNLIDSVLNAVSGIIKDVFSGDLFVTLFKSLTSGTGKVINALSFGLHGKIMNEFTNSNAKEVAETTNKLTSSNEVLKRSIDALKDEMEKARGADTVRVYDEALKKQKELIENTGDVLAAQMGYHSSHHSNDYYIDKSMSRDDWQRISDRTGKQVSSTSDLWNLSPEDLKKVSTLTDIWDKIYNGGKYDKSGYIDQYLELADTLGQLETQLQETLTQTTFDSVYDNFVDTLMDMNKSAEDFADDLSKVFMKAILSNQIGQEYATKLEEWYKKFAKDMEDGTLTDEEREVLKNEYMSYVDAAIKERDELAKTIGYNSDNKDESGVTGKLQAALTEGTANEVLGVINMSALDLRTLKGLTAEHFKDYATEMNYISNLVDEARQINVNTKRTADNTDGLIDKLDTGFKGLKNELAEIKKNTKDTSGR